MAAQLQRLGVQWHGFESADDVGGTWHGSRRYPGLALHTPVLGATFAGFPYPSGREADASPDTRPSGEEMHAYLRRFAEANGLLRRYTFSAQVRGVHMSAHARSATLTVAGDDDEEERAERSYGPFDVVVYASLASEPVVPPLAGSFEGVACHVCEVRQASIARALAARQRVVVVGGGRSGCDAVLALLKAGVHVERLTWLVRRPFFFWKLERCWHRCSAHNGGRWLPRLRGLGAAIAFWICNVAPAVGWRVFWGLDYVYTPHMQMDVGADVAGAGAGGGAVGGSDGAACVDELSKWCGDPAFHMGLLDADQRRALAQVRPLELRYRNLPRLLMRSPPWDPSRR